MRFDQRRTQIPLLLHLASEDSAGLGSAGDSFHCDTFIRRRDESSIRSMSHQAESFAIWQFNIHAYSCLIRPINKHAKHWFLPLCALKDAPYLNKCDIRISRLRTRRISVFFVSKHVCLRVLAWSHLLTFNLLHLRGCYPYPRQTLSDLLALLL